MTISELIGGLLGGVAGGAIERTMERGAISKILEAPSLEAQEDALTSNIGYLSEAQAGLLTSQLKQRRDEQLGADIAASAKDGTTPERLPTNALQPYTQLRQTEAKTNTEKLKIAKDAYVNDVVQKVLRKDISEQDALKDVPPQFYDDLIERLEGLNKFHKGYLETQKAELDVEKNEKKLETDTNLQELMPYLVGDKIGEPIPSHILKNQSPETLEAVMQSSPQASRAQTYEELAAKRSAEQYKSISDGASDYEQKTAILNEAAARLNEFNGPDQFFNWLAEHGLPEYFRPTNYAALATMAKQTMGGLKDIFGGRMAVAEFIYVEQAILSAGKSKGANLAILAKEHFMEDLKKSRSLAADQLMKYYSDNNLPPPMNLQAEVDELLRNSGQMDILVQNFETNVRAAMSEDVSVPEGHVYVAIPVTSSSGSQSLIHKTVPLEVYRDALGKGANTGTMVKANIAGKFVFEQNKVVDQQ